MSLDTRQRRVRSAIAPLLIAAMIVSPGCSSWKALHGSPETQQVTPMPHHVHVLLADGRRIEMFSPRVEGDSLVGMCPASSGRNQCAFASRDVLRIESRQFSAGRTLLLVGGVVVFLGAAGLLAFALTYDPS